MTDKIKEIYDKCKDVDSEYIKHYSELTNYLNDKGILNYRG